MPLIHVTSVFPPPPVPIPPDALYRGRYVHAVTALMDQGKALAEPIYPDWAGFVAGWEKAKRDLGVIVLDVEQPMKDETRGYCGTPDRRLAIRSRRGEGIVDLKCDASGSGTPTWYVGMQTAAYVGESKRWRGACVLHPDGTYRWHDDRTSTDIFRATDWREFCARLYVVQQDIARGLREAPAAREE